MRREIGDAIYLASTFPGRDVLAPAVRVEPVVEAFLVQFAERCERLPAPASTVYVLTAGGRLLRVTVEELKEAAQEGG